MTIRRSLRKCKNIFEDFSCDGHKWDSVVVDPQNTENVKIDGVVVPNNFYTREALKEVNGAYQGTCSRRKLKDLEEGRTLLKEIRLKVKHEDRRRHMFIFSRCEKTDPYACSDCRRRPQKVPKEVREQLPPRHSGAEFWVPEEDKDLQDQGLQFKTFMQQVQFIKDNRSDLKSGLKKLIPDVDLDLDEKQRCKVILIYFGECQLLVNFKFCCSLF